MINKVILTIVGVAFLLSGILEIKENAYLRDNGIKVSGIVNSFEKKRRLNYPIIQFRTKEQELVTKNLGHQAILLGYSIGDPVNLIHDPKDPYTVKLDLYFFLIIYPLLSSTIGLIILIYILYLLFIRFKGISKPNEAQMS